VGDKGEIMKLWGGRFEKETEDIAMAFSASLSFDRRLASYDLQVSEVHAMALEECGVLTSEERDRIVTALMQMEEEMDKGTFPFSDDEDIHTAVERVLVDRLGEVGAKLRTGRSRNDQVVADLRLYLMDMSVRMCQRLMSLMEAVLGQAENNLGVIMPGFTHLQPAQPVLLSHHLLAYFEMFKRDVGRLMETRRRMDCCPLGSGALAGVTFPLNRKGMAEELGFREVTANSIDAVSDRDFVADFLYACSMTAVHMSRLAEELILWITPRFGFLVLDEAYATGSSIMPQKANLDVAELARGKTGRIIGHLVSLLTMLKGLPLAYNRDLQEDKEGLFDTVDQMEASIEVMAGVLATASFNASKMREAAIEGYSNATDLADHLVRKGRPFLEAHELVGKLIRLCLEKGVSLEELPLEDIQRYVPDIGEDVFEHLSIDECVKARSLPGGTAPDTVEQAAKDARSWLEAERERWLAEFLHST
jgi:argininosuccinate lyase